MSIPSDRRAQVWYSDFMVGVLIFSIVVFSYFYYVEHTDYSDDVLQSSLLSEAKSISGYLMTKGYPLNWTAADVTTIGLIDGDYRIDEGKLADFTSLGYEERRSYIHTTKDYYFALERINGSRFNELCKEEPGECQEWNESDNLVQDTRLVIYGNEPVRMVIYIYQQP